MIKTFDRSTVKAMRQPLEDALSVIEKQFGVKVTVGNASFTGENVTFKVELATVAADGTVNDKHVSDFKMLCGMYDLKPEHLGAEVVYAGTTYKITGLNPKAPRYPINVERVSDGRGFRLPERAVRALTTDGASVVPPAAPKPQAPLFGSMRLGNPNVPFVPNTDPNGCKAEKYDFKANATTSCANTATTKRQVGFGKTAPMVAMCAECANRHDQAKAEMAAEARCS